VDGVGGTSENIDAAQAIAAAVAQMELAVREVQPPVEQLGVLIGKMADGLRAMRSSHVRNLDPESISVFPDDFDRAIGELGIDVQASITHLQFYDRLVQHLSHVLDYMSSVAEQLVNATETDADVWGTLSAKLRKRLISAAQRELLDMVLPPSQGAHSTSRQAREEHAAQGTDELF
jgi:hypothetical protein